MLHLQAKKLSVNYGPHCILNEVNLAVEQGEFVAIVGKSGSGKSTLLKALANFIPYQGHIIRPQKLGMIFQDYAAFPWFTVAGNIGFGLAHHSPRERQKIIDKHLDLIGLADRKNSYPHELSGGQIQRVALARSLAANPDILLMDEPYGALDVHTRDQMQRWLLQIVAQEQKTIIFVTHHIEEAIFLADRVLVLDEGNFKHELVVPFSRPRPDEIKFSSEFNKLRQDIFCMLHKS